LKGQGTQGQAPCPTKGGVSLKKKYNPYALPSWLKNLRAVVAQFAVPICIFQGIRTLLFPTGFDILLLIIMILLAAALHLELI
jgi:hypothetical protein